MNCLDHLLAFVDNGGRRSYVERRRNSKLARIPERRTGKDRRINYDRRRTQYVRAFPVPERRMKSPQAGHRPELVEKEFNFLTLFKIR